MKKLFLFALLTSLVGLAQAQQTTVRAPERVQPQLLQNESVEGPSIFHEFLPAQENLGTNAARKSTGLKKTTFKTNLFEIGKMANVYGMMGDTRQQIAYDPKSNRVAVIFRGNDRGQSDGNTLFIRYSSDGGATWGDKGDNIANTTQPRYPNLALVPENDGSTSVAAYWAQTTQYNDGNSGFGAVGSMKAGFGNANPLYSPFPTPPLWSIPWEPVLNQQTGDLYTIALALDPANGASTGELYLLKSTDRGASWTADLSNPVYTDDITPSGYFDSNLRLDISPDGSTMIMAFSLIIESEPGRAFLVDPNHEIAWRVSTNMGLSWGDLQRVKPSGIQNLPQPFDFQCNMSWDFDMTIGKNNKPHFLTILSADLNPFGLDRPTDTTIALNSTDSTFACEVAEIDGQGWRILPIGPARRLRTDRISFTAASTTSTPYLIRNEPKWARTWSGDKIFAKWISPYLTWRIGVVAGQPTLFPDTLLQVYINGRHVDSKTIGNPYLHPWDFAEPDNNTFDMDSTMRFSGDLLGLFEEDGAFGAKFTKVAKYASDNGDVFVIVPEFGVGERRDDDALFSDQTIWFLQGAQLPNIMVNVEQLDATPGSFSLEQNYPNPFNPATQINFTLPAAGQTTLRVFNVLGQQVATLVDAQLTAGTHSVTFDARSLPSGVYMYRLESGNMSMSQKMMLSK
jgi:hypothetical protein